MRKRFIILPALALAAAAPPVFGQADAWQRKWYWGVHAAAYAAQTPTATGREFGIGGGAHWLITGKRSALFVGFDQYFFPDSSTSAIPDASGPGGVRVVDFNQGRRIQAILYAVPTDHLLQVMLGGGFSLNQVTNAVPRGPFATLTEAVNAGDIVAERDTRAFFVFSGGAQLRVGRMAVYGSYQYMPSASTFLLTGQQHVLTAGVRYALTGSHEDVSTQN